MISKERIEEIMETHIISSDNEAREALEFVRDLMDAYVEDLEENEPYATASISKMVEVNMTLASILDNLD